MSVQHKGFNIKSDGTFSLFNVHRVGPGKIPVELLGSYTNTKNAQVAIDAYVTSKGDKNAKTNRVAGG